MKKILLILFLFLLFLLLLSSLSGCAWFEDKRVAVKPFLEIDPNSPEFRRTLSLILNNRYEYMNWIRADLELAKLKTKAE